MFDPERVLRQRARARASSSERRRGRPRGGSRRPIGAPLLQLSTDYVFDGALNRPYREDDPPGPRSAYGRSKLLGERLVAERCANSVIVRTAWLFSPYGGNFVRTMLSLNETRDEVWVVADQRGNPTSAFARRCRRC